jgi:hypothetical protein
VLVKLADYVHSETRTAWPAFETLAADTGVGRMTVIRAINTACRLGIVKRIKKGGKKGGRGISNLYVFDPRHSTNLRPCQHDDIVPTSPRHSTNQSSTQYQPETLSSNDLLKDNLIGKVSMRRMEERKELGEEKSEYLVWTTPSLTEIEYTPELRALYLATEPKKKQTPEEFEAEMAARGLNMAQSRRRVPLADRGSRDA